MFGRRIQNDNLEHGSPNIADKSADADDYVLNGLNGLNDFKITNYIELGKFNGNIVFNV